MKVATFDCYGTLVDWEGGAAAFLYDLARRNGDADPEPGLELRERWEEIQFEDIQKDYRTYHEVLREATARVGRRARLPLEREGERGHRARDAELAAVPRHDPRPAAREEGGLRLVIISNTDRHIMEHTLRQLAPLEFDAVVVAEDVRAYKPDTSNFLQALQACGEKPEQILHVAFGFKYDIAPAQEVGCRPPGSTATASRAPGDVSPTTSGATCGAWRSSPRLRREPPLAPALRSPPRSVAGSSSP